MQSFPRSVGHEQKSGKIWLGPLKFDMTLDHMSSKYFEMVVRIWSPVEILGQLDQMTTND